MAALCAWSYPELSSEPTARTATVKSRSHICCISSDLTLHSYGTELSLISQAALCQELALSPH